MLELTNKQFEAFHSSGEPVRGPASAIPRYETPLLLCNRMQQDCNERVTICNKCNKKFCAHTKGTYYYLYSRSFEQPKMQQVQQNATGATWKMLSQY
jgi:hypothetical protein